jgi:hypothetical protein
MNIITVSMATFSLLTAAAVAVAAAQPQPGPLGQISPLANLKMGFRHCNYIASACPLEQGNTDFSFAAIPAKNGQPAPAFSLQSVSYPTYYIGLVNVTSGAIGIVNGGDANDVTWAADDPLAPAPPGTTDAYSLRSLRCVYEVEL